MPVEEAFEAVAIQLTNGFEVNLPSMSGRAVYPMISYVNHSCVPNVAHSHKMISHDKGKIVLKAIQVYLGLGGSRESVKLDLARHEAFEKARDFRQLSSASRL